MNAQELMAMAAKAFLDGAGSKAGGLDLGTVAEALQGLLSGPDGKVDLPGLLARMNGQGLMDLANSWLSSGGNQAISAESILSVLGKEHVDGFAQRLGLPEQDAVSGLQAAIPQLVDQASPNGDLAADLGAQLLQGGLKNLFR